MTSTEHTPTATIAVATAMALFGINNVIVRTTGLSGTVTASYRLFLGAALLVAVLGLTGRPPTAEGIRVALAPGFAYGLSILLFFSAFKATSIANATLIAALQSGVSLTVVGRFFGEKVRPAELALTGVATGGVALVILGGEAGGAGRIGGDLLAVAAMVANTAYFVLAKQATTRSSVGTGPFQVGLLVVAAVMTVPLVVVSGDASVPDGGDWVRLLVLAVGGTVGHLGVNWAHRHVTLTTASLLTLAVPVVSSTVAWFVLDELLSPMQWVGAGVTLASLAMVVLRAVRPDRVPVGRGGNPRVSRRGGPLLPVAGEPLAGVGAGEPEHLVGEAGVEGRQLGPVPVVEGVLGPADRALRAPGELHGQLEGTGLLLAVVDAQGDEADPFGLLPQQLVAGQQVVLGLGHPAQQRPAHCGVVAGRHPEAGVAVDDPGRATDHGDVGQHGGDEPGTDGHAVHGGDHRLGQLEHVGDEVTRLTKRLQTPLLGGHGLLDQVEAPARGERLPRPLEHDHPDGGVAVDDRPDVGELAVHVGRDGVQAGSVEGEAQDRLGGPVEADVAEVAVALVVADRAVVVGHGRCASRKRMPGNGDRTPTDATARVTGAPVAGDPTK